MTGLVSAFQHLRNGRCWGGISVLVAMNELPKAFPFQEVFADFLRDYQSRTTYWYVPKTRALNDENVQAMRRILNIVFEGFLDRTWNPETQDELLDRLIEQGILEPYAPDGTLADRTALVRILKKLLETLGLLWIEKDNEIIITDAGLESIIADDPHQIIDGQIAKIQYPNPTLTGRYAEDFHGLLPHLFLLQVLQETDYHITKEEYELFVNLAQQQEDLPSILRYIRHWRDLNESEQEVIRQIARDVPMAGDEEYSRYDRIGKSSPYQRSLYVYPPYLEQRRLNADLVIICKSPEQVDELVREKVSGLKVPTFDTKEDWFAYMGDPMEHPSWFTYLSLAVEKADTEEEAVEIVEQHKEELTPEETQRIQRKRIEKGVESFYVENFSLLEIGLRLVPNGRQYSTPIGRIDLLCQSRDGEYVVIEIKADEADDSAFGQILRYIGWVHRNIEDAENNVRGIILAGKFPETARYSRIGLLKDDYKDFLKFKKHGFQIQDT